MINHVGYIIGVIFCLQSCVEIQRPYTQLPPGIWRAELQLNEDITLPFNMETLYDADGKLAVYVLNADERISVGEVLLEEPKT